MNFAGKTHHNILIQYDALILSKLIWRVPAKLKFKIIHSKLKPIQKNFLVNHLSIVSFFKNVLIIMSLEIGNLTFIVEHWINDLITIHKVMKQSQIWGRLRPPFFSNR